MKIMNLPFYFLVNKSNRMNWGKFRFFLQIQFAKWYSFEEKLFSAYLSSKIVSYLEEELYFFNAIQTKDLCQIINFTLNKEK